MKHLWITITLMTVAACSPAPSAAPAPTSAAPKLRDLATVDACTLLVASDFAKPFTKAPEPLSSPLTCRWAIEAQTIWMSIENESLEQAKVRVGREGSELKVEGHQAWWGVQFESSDEPPTSTGTVVTELAADRVLVMHASRTPPNYDIGMVARTRSVAVVQRLFS
ncbi:hypothetical protein ACWGE0_22540 [Lentzea sp. NPDC054927]